MNRILIFVFALLLFNSCIKKKGGKVVVTIANDLETTAGFSTNENNVQTLVKGYAHSGLIACKIDSVNKYGYLYRAKFSQLPTDGLKSIVFTCWTSLENEKSRAVLVISVDDPDNRQLFWTGYEINKSVKEIKSWKEVTVEAEISQFNQPGNKISVYVWNSGNDVTYSDDYKIEFLK